MRRGYKEKKFKFKNGNLNPPLQNSCICSCLWL